MDEYRLTKSDVTQKKGEFMCPPLKTLSKNDSVGVCEECHGVLFALRVVKFDGQRIVEPRCLGCLAVHEPLTNYSGNLPPDNDPEPTPAVA